ncbi:hypothetical protein [Saccharibacter floricola]|uniref:Uncharacterized protein n=1 Tax=Saccharibacter floricola DSM 15669 TaxID=1123227 RepID=A0ABQ0NZW2_9PROT|nr:hypothetical protein [Saccharibacter floricola]GBQ05032.1 hypothetical protein AA15669_0270 [Saccharibacter floricola DSM 15669]
MIVLTLDSPEIWILWALCGVVKGEFTANDINAICQDVDHDVCDQTIRDMVKRRIIFESEDGTIYLKRRQRRSISQYKRINNIVFKGRAFEDIFNIFFINKYVTQESFDKEIKKLGSLCPEGHREWCWPSGYILSALCAVGKIDVFWRKGGSYNEALYFLAKKDAPFLMKNKKSHSMLWGHFLSLLHCGRG